MSRMIPIVLYTVASQRINPMMMRSRPKIFTSSRVGVGLGDAQAPLHATADGCVDALLALTDEKLADELLRRRSLQLLDLLLELHTGGHLSQLLVGQRSRTALGQLDPVLSDLERIGRGRMVLAAHGLDLGLALVAVRNPRCGRRSDRRRHRVLAEPPLHALDAVVHEAID